MRLQSFVVSVVLCGIAIRSAWGTVLTASPSPRVFGSVSVSLGAVADTVTLNNDNDGAVTVTGLSMGAGCGEFTAAAAGGVPALINNNGSLTVDVTYNPVDRIADTCTVTPTFMTGGSGGSFQLTGVGTAPQLMVTPGALPFAAQRWNGGTPQMQDVTITNIGDEPIAMANLTVSLTTGTHYSLGAVTGLPINTGQMATVAVTFDPTSLGASLPDTVTVSLNNDSPGDANPTVALSGSGIQSNQTFPASPFTIGSALVGAAVTAPNPVTIGNTGAAVLTFNGGPPALEISGGQATEFAFTDHGCSGLTCNPTPITIDPGLSTTFTISCTPAGAGLRSTTLTVRSDDPLSPKNLTLQCTGQVPMISTSPAATMPAFALTQVGATTTTQNLVISNAVGAAPLTYSVVSNAPTEFVLSCPSAGCLAGTIDAGSSVTVRVAFAPQATMLRMSTLTITNGDPNNNPRTINVSGTGGLPSFSAAPSPLVFGNVPVAQVNGATSNVTITNGGTVQLDISQMTITGDPTMEFTFADADISCTSGQICNTAVPIAALPGPVGSNTNVLTLRCNPATPGNNKTATLNVVSDSPTSPDTVMLTCNGTVPDVIVGAAPPMFADTRLNTNSLLTPSFTVSNSNVAGTAPMDYTVSESSTQFSITCVPLCSGTLNQGQSATVTVTFRPTFLGLQSTNIVVSTPADPDELTTNVFVSGIGVEPRIVLDAPTPVTPPTVGGVLAFGSVNVGTTSTAQAITVTNNGTQDLLITGVTNTNLVDFTLTGPATITLGPSVSQTWMVTCDPITRGAKAGQIQIANNSANDTSVDVALTCFSAEGLLVVTASPVAVVSNQIDFGPVRLGNMVTTTVTVTNQGNVAVTISAVTLSSMVQGFSVAGFTPNTVVAANNGTTTFTAVFAPTLESHGVLTVMAITSDWNDPNTNLVGDGQLADAALTPGTANIPDVQWDGTGLQVMTITNTGTAVFNVLSAALTSGAGECTITGFTAGNLLGGNARPFNLNAIPTDTMLGQRTCGVRVTTNLTGPGQFLDATVTYTSVGPAVTLTPGMVVNFGGVDVDAGPTTLQLMLSNTGSGLMDITAVGALSGVFTKTAFADLTLTPAQAEAVTITYDPTMERDAGNPETQTFTITTDGLYTVAGGQQPASVQVTVQGYGIDRHLLAPNVVFPPTYRNPTDAQVPTATCGGTLDQPCAVRVCNTGGARLDVSMIDDPDDAFDLAATGPLMVSAGSAATPTCMDVPVEFRPPSYGSFSGTVTIVNNDNAAPMRQVTLSGDGVARPVGVMPSLVPAATIAQGAPVRLSDLVPGGLIMVNMSGVEAFVADVSPVPNTGGVTATLVGDDGNLAASQTRELDVELVGTAPGQVDVVVNVYLDGDPIEHSSLTIPLEVVRVDVEGGGCDSGGGGAGAAGGGAAALGLVALMAGRRRRAIAGVVATLAVAGLTLSAARGARADVSRNIDVGAAPTTTATEPGLFDVDTPDIAPRGSWAFSLSAQHEQNPMVARWTDSASVEHELALIETRDAFVVGFGYALSDQLELSARMPMYSQKGAERMSTDPFGVEGAEGFSLGDAAVRAKMQMVRGTVGFAGALDVTAPTGKDGQFAGTDLPTAHLQGLLGVRSGRRISLALNGGFLARQSTQFLLIEQGSELTYGAAVAVRVLDKVALIGEGSGALGVVGAEGKVSPIELTLGLRVRASRGATIGIGGGSGFGKAVGVADMRGFVSLVIAPGGSTIEPVRIIVPPPPRDVRDDDGDGVVNADDVCPTDADDNDGFKDEDGCPEADNDDDGLLDGADQCPLEAEDKDGFTDDDGCIDADNDSDGVNDLDDKCPNEAEDKDGFNDNDGCDEPDNDNDGVPDVLDQCALEAETINGNDDEDGCPDKGDPTVMLMQDRIEVLEPIQFVGLTPKLKPSAAKVLSQVGATMRAERGVKRVRVTVHVHPRGAGDDVLSEKRADEIRKWLVQWGVEPERIDAKGIGSKRPLVAKHKRGADEINDRVEFIILER